MPRKHGGGKKKPRAWRLVAVIISMAIGSGCATTRPHAPLPVPERPVLPRVTAQELQCLSDATYEKLVRRHQLLRDYAEDLETIIEATQ